MSVDEVAVPGRRGPYAKTAQRRREIIDAATTVFATRGYHGGSLRDIARQLDLSLTSLVHHFPSKSDLLEAVLENADRTGSVRLRPRARDQGLAAAILDLTTANFDHPEMLRLLAIVSSEASAPDHPAHGWFVARYAALCASITELIRHDVATGRVSSTADPARLARLVLAGWDGLQLQWLLDPSEDMRGAMELLLLRLLPAPPPAVG